MSIFTRIINREIPAEIIYEDDKVIAIKDINPVRNGHFLVIPKNHSENLIDITDEDLKYLILRARELAVKEIKRLGVGGFELHINNGVEVGQEVPHTHIHIIPSKK